MKSKDLRSHCSRSFGVHLQLLLWCGFTLVGCADNKGPAAVHWDGTVDTLPNGTIVVHNRGHGIWDSATAWRVVEEVRIGTLEGTGPDLFGRISAIEVDCAGRIYVLESQAAELRVFEPSGRHVRTFGRRGSNPGDLREAIGMAWSPANLLWVVDAGNSRISVFDTAGAFVTMHRIVGGHVTAPWPSGFDESGRFYHYGFDAVAEPGGRVVMVRFDTLLNPLDTMRIPRPRDDSYFELQSAGGLTRAEIPFTGNTTFRIGPTGHIWFADTGDYRIYKRSAEGDTVLIVSRDFQPLSVTSADIDSAIVGLDWFVRQGGRIDRSRFPREKPAISSFCLDDESRLWVVPFVASEDMGRLIDVFEPSGRYLGRLRLPFRLAPDPIPVFRHGAVFAVTLDEFQVPYVVRAKLEQP